MNDLARARRLVSVEVELKARDGYRVFKLYAELCALQAASYR